MPERRNWSEDETILAYYYFCQIPYNQISNPHNEEIVRIAGLIGRTIGSVQLKMYNLAHFDPSVQSGGMPHGSKTDKDVVQRFVSNWEDLVVAARLVESKLQSDINMPPSFPVGGEHNQTVRRRVNQDFFRDAVLAAYNNKCCITGIEIPDLLIASHIKPWRDSNPETERTNPSNGLCLNALHDKAFDKGLITVLPDYTIRVSSKLSQASENLDWLRQCDNQKIILPGRFLPAKEFLEYHNDMIFVG